MLNAPQDGCPPGKYPILQNVRAYQQETLQSRLGLTLLVNGALGQGSITAIARLNDPTPFAASPFFRLFGAGTQLRGGNATYPALDTGFSGNPLTICIATPVQAPEPWAYVADSSKMSKSDVNGHNGYPIGIAPPVNPPTLVLNPLFHSIVTIFSGTPWVNAGAAASGLTSITRVNTVISQIFYDNGTTGPCSIVPAGFTGFDAGMLVTLNGTETEPVQFVTIAVASTTIGSIIYDSGSTGLCTIQPTASLGTGQIDAPPFDYYLARAGGYAVPRDSVSPTVDLSQTGLVPRIRQVDFPVNALVSLSGTEIVRIQSVAIGRDGVQSFRCATALTHAAGDTIVGVEAFRIDTQANFVAGNSLVDNARRNTITPSGSPPTATAGLMTGVGWTPLENPAFINGVATLPDDDVHLAIRISDCTVVTSVRVYFDVDASTNNFLQNYYFFEWRPNDIITAIQAANTATVSPLQTTRQLAVSNAILNQAVARSSGNRGAPSDIDAALVAPNTAGSPIQAQAITSALALGNNQWLSLHCKVRDLVRVGTDPGQTLANMAAAEVLVSIAGPNPVTVDYDSIFFTGGRGLDSGEVAPTYVYCYRYRSSLTGAISNPSPATRGGIVARRQGATVTGAQSADPQCDLVDWFRFGGGLTEWTYAGTTANTNPPVFTDTQADTSLIGGPTLDYDRFKPWATFDLPRTGTCKVAGTAVQRLSGANFNTSWSPGTPIQINNQVYTLYAQPLSTSLLFINENAGSFASTTFTVTEPTLIGQPLPALWGDITGYYFACGDLNNPGMLYWSFPFDPDRTSDKNTLVVCSGSEFLQHGFVWDSVGYVFSNQQLYVLQITPGGTPEVQAFITPCGKGLWARWAFCWTPMGLVFLSDDGIYLTAGGGRAQSLTDADLYPLFPHDGNPGLAVNGINPPNMALTTRLRLAYVNEYVYFDYVDSVGTGRTLAYHMPTASWWPDLSTPGVQCRLAALGPGVLEELIGGSDGTVYTPGGLTDNGTAIACQARVVDDQGDIRRQKIYRDFMVDLNSGGGTLNVNIGLDNNSVNIGLTALSPATGRVQVPTGITPALGSFGRNVTLDFTWNPFALGFTGGPILYGWDVAWQPAPELSTSWLSGPTTHGLPGYQQVLGVYLAYRSNGPINLSVIIDNVRYNYPLPTSNSQYVKIWQILQAVKGLGYQWGVQTVNANTFVEVFDQDVEVLVQPWGQGGNYRRVRPF